MRQRSGYSHSRIFHSLYLGVLWVDVRVAGVPGQHNGQTSRSKGGFHWRCELCGLPLRRANRQSRVRVPTAQQRGRWRARASRWRRRRGRGRPGRGTCTRTTTRPMRPCTRQHTSAPPCCWRWVVVASLSAHVCQPGSCQVSRAVLQTRRAGARWHERERASSRAASARVRANTYSARNSGPVTFSIVSSASRHPDTMGLPEGSGHT